MELLTERRRLTAREDGMKTKHTCSAAIILGLIIALMWSFACADEPTRILSSWKPTQSTPGDLLRSAAFDGNLNEIRRLLANGVNVNCKDEEGWTPLFWAQLGNQPEAVQLVLERGANVDAKDKAGYTALHQAAVAGRDQVMEVLLRYGASVDTVSRKGFTPLMDASAYGRAMVVELLLAGGADPNAMTRDGKSALSVAERNSQRHVAMLLVANGADPNIQRKRLTAALAAINSKNRGPSRVRLAGQLRNPDVLETVVEGPRSSDPGSGLKFVAVQTAPANAGALDPRAFQSVRVRGDKSVQPGRSGQATGEYAIREAVDTWEQLQAKYPDLNQRIRQLSERGISVEKLSAKDPLLKKALGIWQSLQSEHPDLVAQMLSLAGMGR
jgi:hypothetical protein